MATVDTNERIIYWGAFGPWLKSKVGPTILIALPFAAVSLVLVEKLQAAEGEYATAKEDLVTAIIYGVIALATPKLLSLLWQRAIDRIAVAWLLAAAAALYNYTAGQTAYCSPGSDRIWRLKEMATAYQTYLADNDGCHPLPNRWQAATRMYGSSVDDNLSMKFGTPTLNVFQPSLINKKSESCVLFYTSTRIGKNLLGAGADAFWEKDRNMVAMGDGHVKRVSRSEFAKLPWMGAQ